MKANPPAAEDAPMVAKLAKIGIVPGKDFDASKLDPAVAKGIAAAPKPGQEKIIACISRRRSSPVTPRPRTDGCSPRTPASTEPAIATAR